MKNLACSLLGAAFLLSPWQWTNAATFAPIWARDGMVVTSVRPAAPAGAEVLRNGGNAYDAAIATAFAAAVAHPFSSGLGGGLFAVSVDQTGTATALDARETGPSAMKSQRYQEDPGLIRYGALSVGVPGFVQGLWALHQRYGTKPWAELIEPAIALAEEGVEVSVWHNMITSRIKGRLADYPETARIQLNNGEAPELGWKLIQKDLAKTLRHIQKHGETALAEGEIAQKIVLATNNAISLEDLSGYQVKWRDPIRGTYQDYEIISMPPPSSGGVLLVEMFNMLSHFDLPALGHGSSDYIHTVSEVMKLAFADRARYLGDPDFNDIPVARLTSADYAETKARLIRPDRLVTLPELPAAPDDEGTTHISVMDGKGNAVALTQTINSVFGSLITVPGTGIVLNNELDDFSIAPNVANIWEAVGSSVNAPAPGKRPLSSMTPTIVMKDGKPAMVVGSPMGTMIISSVLHSLLNVIEFGMNPQQAVQAPRFHHQWKPEQLFLEPEFSRDVRDSLTEIGHVFRNMPIIGAAQLIYFNDEACYFRGGADGRRDSGAAAVNLPEVTERRSVCKTGN